MTDILTSIRWVVSTLKNDATLAGLVGTRVVSTTQQGAVYPLIRVRKMSAVPVKVASNMVKTAMFDELILVTAVSKGTDNTASAAIMNRVRAVLDGASGTAVAGTVIACIEEMEVPLPEEISDGVVYQNCAVEFRIYTQ